MKRMIALAVTLVVLSLASVGLSQPARAEAVFNFRGQLATASFSSVDSSGCIFTDVFVFAGENEFGGPPGSPTFEKLAGVVIVQFDFCTGASFIGVDVKEIAEQEFQMLGNLGSATLDTTFVVGPGITLSADVTWTGVGDIDHEPSHFGFGSPGFVIVGHENDRTRAAVAAGTISDGTTNFIPAPSTSANLVWILNGTITV